MAQHRVDSSSLPSLQELRDNIDSVDDEILKALQRRMELVAQIGEVKLQQGGAIYRPEREREILNRLAHKNATQSDKAPLLNALAIEAIYHEIFATSRNLELPQKVAFLGPIGSYTHQAAQDRFGAMSEYIPLSTISAIFDALSHKRVKYGVLPLENNTNGMVGESIDLLATHEFKIIAEIVLPIHHSFLSTCEHLDMVEKIFSKDIAFGQCQKFLSAHNLSHIEQIPTDSTARAAQLAAQTPRSAAIGSRIAGKLYNLPLMFENIQDSEHNKTRFVIVSDFANAPSGRDKTSLFVNLKGAEEVGSLYGLLGDFKKEGINLSKISSRPIRTKPSASEDGGFKMGFFIDCEGHYNDSAIQNLIAKRGDEIKWLGSYLPALAP